MHPTKCLCLRTVSAGSPDPPLSILTTSSSLEAVVLGRCCLQLCHIAETSISYASFNLNPIMLNPRSHCYIFFSGKTENKPLLQLSLYVFPLFAMFHHILKTPPPLQSSSGRNPCRTKSNGTEICQS